MKKSPCWEAQSRSAGEEISYCLRNRRFITFCKRIRHWSLLWASISFFHTHTP